MRRGVEAASESGKGGGAQVDYDRSYLRFAPMERSNKDLCCCTCGCVDSTALPPRPGSL